MKKRFWSLVLAAVMILTALPLSGVTAAAAGGYKVQVTSGGNGEVAIEYFGNIQGWGADYSSYYSAGEYIELDARADDGYHFVGWFATPSSVDPVSTDISWRVRVNEPIHYYALFAEDYRTIHTVVTTGGALPVAGQTPYMHWSARNGSHYTIEFNGHYVVNWTAYPDDTADNWGPGRTFLPGHRYRVELEHCTDDGWRFDWTDPDGHSEFDNYLQDIPSNRYIRTGLFNYSDRRYAAFYYTFLTPFSDVTDTSLFYYDAVYWLGLRGYAGGWADGTFRPLNKCNRASVVTFLWRMAGRPEPSAMATFSDMPENTAANSDFRNAISWAVEKGITTGWDDNTFRPWQTCNRAAIVTFLYRYAGDYSSSTAPFSDMTGNAEFDQAISWAASHGIVTGWDDNTFRPWDSCNRLAVASFLYRYEVGYMCHF